MAVLGKTNIAGFTVEVMTSDNGVNCYISKAGYSASLACAYNEGELTSNANDSTMSVPDVVCEEAQRFADRYGY